MWGLLESFEKKYCAKTTPKKNKMLALNTAHKYLIQNLTYGVVKEFFLIVEGI
jgi:hypothetical protein